MSSVPSECMGWWYSQFITATCDTKENTSPFNIIVAKMLLKKEDLKFETGHVRQL